FKSMVSSHAESLKMYALHFTHDDEDANDLVQDTVLKAITYHEKFKEGTNLKGWLYTIMKNTFINNYRRFVKISGMVTKSDEISSLNLVYSSTMNIWENKFVMYDSRESMAKLTEEYYVPFTLYFVEYIYQEIHEHRSIPIG